MNCRHAVIPLNTLVYSAAFYLYYFIVSLVQGCEEAAQQQKGSPQFVPAADCFSSRRVRELQSRSRSRYMYQYYCYKERPGLVYSQGSMATFVLIF